MPTKKYPWEQLPNYAGAPVLPDMPNIPGAINLPDLPEYGQIPDAPTLGDMPTMPDMYTLPDMPDMYTLPDMPERGAIPEIPDAMRALYEESPETLAAYQNYLASVGQKPSDYSSQYLPQMDAIMQKYGSQAPFNYDINGDMLYQQMKDQYIRNGQRAMMDAQGQASAMTGGYGSTYAQGVGQQQYNQHLEALNNNIPALYDRQYQQYRDQRGDLLNQFNMAGNLENTNYGRYRDTVGDWKDETSRTYGEFMDSRSFGYNKYLNEIQQAGTVYNKELDNFWNQYNDDMNRYGIKKEDVMNTYAEMMARYGEDKVDIQNVYNELMNRYDTNLSNIWDVYGANVDQAKWQTQFNYGQQQDALAQQNWQEQFQYGKEQDALSQQNWDKQFGYGVETDEKQQAYQLAMTLLQSGKMPTDQMLETAGIDKETAGMLRAMMSGSLAGTVGGGSTSRSSNGGSGKKLTAAAWDAIQAAGETGGKDAMFKEAAKYEAMGYNVQPVIDWSGTYLKPQWDADQKKIEDSYKTVDGLMNFGSAVYNTVGSLVPNALSSIFNAIVPKKPEPEKKTPPKKDYKDRLGR